MYPIESAKVVPGPLLLADSIGNIQLWMTIAVPIERRSAHLPECEDTGERLPYFGCGGYDTGSVRVDSLSLCITGVKLIEESKFICYMII